MRCSSEPPSSRLRLLDGGIVAVVVSLDYFVVVVVCFMKFVQFVLGRGGAREW